MYHCKLDVTKVVQASRYGFCVEVQSNLSPTIVLPKSTTVAGDRQDCLCPITTRDDCNLADCHCITDTAFAHSFNVCRVVEHSNTYSFCFLNLTSEMNDTIIHTYESYRFCSSTDGASVFDFKPHRKYQKSFRISIGM